MHTQLRHLYQVSSWGLNAKVASNSGRGMTGKNKGSIKLGFWFDWYNAGLESQMLTVLQIKK